MTYPCASCSLYKNFKRISLEHKAGVLPTETARAVVFWDVHLIRQRERVGYLTIPSVLRLYSTGQ
jgi:hypothetical protein